MDTYQSVTDRIIAQLEQGTAPWVMPWKAGGYTGGAAPFNATSKKAYRGVNVPLLMPAAAAYGDARFVTYKQAAEAGGNVRKGEHGTKIVFWKSARTAGDSEEGAEGDGKARSYLIIREYTVFNVAQCDGLTLPALAPVAPLNPDTRDAHLDAVIARAGAVIREGGGSAFYRPSTDDIHMPAFGCFRGASDFYATLLHELTHWTAAKSRLDRNLVGRFGTESYAAEELIAELGAAFLCAWLGVQGQLQHAEYIASWVRVLKSDKRAIFTAASQAQKAADYLNMAFQMEDAQAA